MRVTQKGQVTIPLPVRRALGIQPGCHVEFELDERGARCVHPAPEVAPALLGERDVGFGKLAAVLAQHVEQDEQVLRAAVEDTIRLRAAMAAQLAQGTADLSVSGIIRLARIHGQAVIRCQAFRQPLGFDLGRPGWSSSAGL